MTTLIRYPDVTLSGRGLTPLDIQADELTLGGLPYLSAWIDPGRRGTLVAPAATDKKSGDMWLVSGSGPAMTTRPNFGGRAAWDFTAGGSLVLKASARLPSKSASCFMVVDVPAGFSLTTSYNILSFFSTGTTIGELFRTSSQGGLTFAPNFGSAASEAISSPANGLTAGAKIIGFSYDETSKTVMLFLGSSTPVMVGTVTTGATLDSNARWRLSGSNVAPWYVGDVLIFDAAYGQIPTALNTLFTTLKARYGLS